MLRDSYSDSSDYIETVEDVRPRTAHSKRQHSEKCDR